jgi:hypothetical protein
MTTYLYWIIVFAAVATALWIVGGLLKQWRVAMVIAAAIGVAGAAAYYFHYQQILVKRWGGVMHISVPDGQRHIGVTWKDDHLWMESYDPASNTCEFREYSRGDLLQGRVVIENCNPL